MRPGSREMWLSEQTSSAELQTDLVHRGATKVARAALVAVGADYNLLLAMQIREEARAGLGAGIIRAFARYRRGGHHRRNRLRYHHVRPHRQHRAQRGPDRCDGRRGLLIDTLVVRSFVLPSIVALLGRWFWWPTRIERKCAPDRSVADHAEPDRVFEDARTPDPSSVSLGRTWDGSGHGTGSGRQARGGDRRE